MSQLDSTIQTSTSTDVYPWDVRSQQLAEPTILCVDDDPGISTAIQLHLRPYAVQVDRAYYGIQGFWESVHHQPDLIIMDLAMPHGDGPYLLACLKQRQETAAIPVIVLTGMRDPQLRTRILNAGADVFLHKPVPFDQLFHDINRFVYLRPRDEPSP